MDETKKTAPNVKGRWTIVVIILLLLGFISVFSSLIIGIFVATAQIEPTGNVAHIKLIGPIYPENPGGLFSSTVGSQEIVSLIKKANENPDIKGILLEINSGGGAAVASYEIAEAVKNSNKTVVAWVRDISASGAYWVASSSDHIVASPISIVGSVGVIASYIEFEGTLHRYNASYRRLVVGEYKDIGSPFKEMTPEEEQVFNDILYDIGDFFLQDVVMNRGLSNATIEDVRTAKMYTGMRAFNIGLVDSLGGKERAIDYLEKTLGEDVKLAKYEREKTLSEILMSASSEHGFLMGQGIGSSMTSGLESGGIVRT